MNEHTITLTHTVKAPQEEVFKAWTDPAELEQWFAPRDLSTKVEKLELREGGAFRIAMVPPDGSAPHVATGVYKEIVSPEKLVLTWLWEGQENETLVTVTFTAAGEGTEVTLVHEGFKTKEDADFHKDGWEQFWAKLEKALA
jgi:uncharacterized protein YndB with AHSA1/START domain